MSEQPLVPEAPIWQLLYACGIEDKLASLTESQRIYFKEELRDIFNVDAEHNINDIAEHILAKGRHPQVRLEILRAYNRAKAFYDSGVAHGSVTISYSF